MPIRRFFNRALEALDRLYGIEGSQSRVDLLALDPVQLVHDVSRNTEAAMGFPANVPLTITTAGAGAATYGEISRASWLATNANTVALLSARGLEPSQVDVWVIGIAAVATTASVANLSKVVAGVRQGNLVGGGVLRALGMFQTGDVNPLETGAVTSLRAADSRPHELLGNPGYPLLMPDDDTSDFHAVAFDGAGGALSTTVYFHVWVAPKGTFPPYT